MKSWFSRLVGGEGTFRRNSLIMSSGAVINIVIAFFLTPVVTRLYSKEEFGVFYIFASIVSIGTLIINGMYPHAFVVPKYKKDFGALVKICFQSGLYGLLVISGILFFFSRDLFGYIGAEKLQPVWYLIPIGIGISSINLIFVNWNVRRKEFKANAGSNVALSGTNKLIQILHGSLLNGRYIGLIGASLLSKALATLVLVSKRMLHDLRSFLRIKARYTKKVAFDFYKYPTYLLGSNLLNKSTADIPLYILAASFNEGAVGAFGFANQMLSIPFNVIGNSIAPVYYQRANELYLSDQNKLISFTIESYKRMLLLGSIVFGFVFAFGDILFEFVFSAEWKLAGELAMILSVYYVFKVISSPFARIFRVVGKEENTLWVNSVLAAFRIAGIVIGVWTKSLTMAILLFTLGNAAGYLFNNYRVFKVVGIKGKEMLIGTLLFFVPAFFIWFMIRVAVDYLLF